MLLLRTDSLPSGEQRLYELKLDGYRAIAFKRNGAIHLRSRNDNDFNARYPEGLVNVRKHSQARNVLVRLTERASEWVLTVEDDGHGFDFAGRVTGAELAARLVGPSIIRERARAIGGDVCVESTPGAGARVEVTFNVPSER
jgi:signal transduction histidine kinase